MRTPKEHLTRSIEGRCHCPSEAGRLLCFACDIVNEFNAPGMRIVVNDSGAPATLDELAGMFELWLAQLSLDLSWAPQVIAFRAMMEDWPRIQILRELRLNGATQL